MLAVTSSWFKLVRSPFDSTSAVFRLTFSSPWSECAVAVASFPFTRNRWSLRLCSSHNVTHRRATCPCTEHHFSLHQCLSCLFTFLFLTLAPAPLMPLA